jgi:DNA-binding PadR family transcriptional regulator
MPSSEYPPLQEPTFFILLSLAEGKKHGYAILKDVPQISNGAVRLGTGTLYGALSRLLDQGMIVQVTDDEPPEADETGSAADGRVRRLYALTQTGWRVLEAEARRLESCLTALQVRLGGERP